MRYDKKIVKEITEELQKVPNVRLMCKKMGIDHSTYYRWINKHFEFHKAVEDALYLGRKNMNDAAESVILLGIQQQDFKSATYWLSHNDERYINERRIKYFQYLDHWTQEFLKRETPTDSQFELLFKHYFVVEEALGRTEAKKHMETILDVVCQEDPKLRDIFYSAYSEWRDNKKDLDSKVAQYDETFPTLEP